MSKKHPHFVFLSGVLLFVLLLSLASPTPVFAQDETPPPPATEEPAQPPVDEPVVTEEPAAMEAPAATDILIEKTGDASPAVEDVTVADVLEAVPEDTVVVVLNENGEMLPLVSEAAAEVVAIVDPVWCPAGQNPGNDMNDGMQNCTDDFATPQELIDAMGTDVDHIFDEDGTIYFTADPGGSFTLIPGSGELDVPEYDSLKIYNLTLQGGWNGNSGAGFALSGETTFTGSQVQIGTDTNPWVGNLTLNDITINGAPTGTGLAVYTQGDITLSNVDANNNTAVGANLVSGGNIDIRSSTFGGGAASGNDLLGLNTAAAGSTTLVEVTASGNGAVGAILGSPVGSGGPITVSESHFDGNGAIGLVAFSGSSITLSNVTASDNAGVVIGLAGANLLGDGPITVTESHFDRNGFGGVLVQSGSEVSLSGVTANGNGSFGALVDATGRVWVSSSYFHGNTDPLMEAIGLAIGSDQSITLDHVAASNNEGDGVILDTFENAIVVCSQFQNNANVGADGWYVDGTFTLNDVTFGGNGMDYDGMPLFMSGGCKVVVGGNAARSGSGHSLLLHIVPVMGGEQVELDCGSYSGTKLILPNGDNVILYCPVLEDAFLTSLTLQGLSDLPGGSTFVSGMEVKVTKGGEVRPDVGPNVIVSFVIPEDKIGSNFVILHWDGSAWTELGGTVAGGYFSVETSLAGVFVLAIR